LLPLAATAARAEWARGEAVDPETGDALSGVTGTNGAGYALVLARDESGGVRAIFRLPAASRDFLAQSEPPRVSIDGAPPSRVPPGAAGLTWVSFPVWNGAGEALTGLLREIMQGKTLSVAYSLHGGGYKETSFQLTGAGEAIAAAFGLRAVVGDDEIRAAAALENALFAAAERCGAEKGKKRERCLAALRACAAEAKTSDELRSCLEKEG
jgi:hypothetical protein